MSSPVPSSPDDRQKYSYAQRNMGLMVAVSVFGFACVTISSAKLIAGNVWLAPLSLLLAYTIVYFIISQMIYFVSSDFDLNTHKTLVHYWKPQRYGSVDVFLPTCGEPLEVLENTWAGVREMQRRYPGVVRVWCLDDAYSSQVRRLAVRFGFTYLSRPDRGWFKKAGNLRHAFERTDGDFIAIFDADFRPRADFLDELLPYFDADPTIGIVQSPQYFDVLAEQNWLERGAGAVQELFYRAVQVSRQSSGGAICVGSNAIYRRAALQQIGGTALIEHSEDVHTGFNLRMAGWRLKYVPVVLAKGLCPSEMDAFFKQQYRWCMGSMSLLTSAKFWTTPLPLMARLCYASGFMYYIHTGIYALAMPLVPLVMIFAIPEQILLTNYLLILPAFIYMHLIFPLWHRVTYGIEAAAVRTIYGWAHLFAIFDKIRASAMEWQATGTTSRRPNNRYRLFRVGVVLFNLVPALFWVGGAARLLIRTGRPDFLPILALGLYYLFTVLKIVVYDDAAVAAHVARGRDVPGVPAGAPALPAPSPVPVAWQAAGALGTPIAALRAHTRPAQEPAQVPARVPDEVAAADPASAPLILTGRLGQPLVLREPMASPLFLVAPG